MDGLRDNFTDALIEAQSYEVDPLDLSGFEDEGDEGDPPVQQPPPLIGNSERRMQLRAYGSWAALLDDAPFPDIRDLGAVADDDFGPCSVLLDFSHGPEDPRLAHFGERLAAECMITGGPQLARLFDVPERTLPSHITDICQQILTNKAPVGFEAEFETADGRTMVYRGVLLPFSSDGRTIDYIYGVLNWKELLDAAMADPLGQEVRAALSRFTAPANRAIRSARSAAGVRDDEGGGCAEWHRAASPNRPLRGTNAPCSSRAFSQPERSRSSAE